MTSYVIFGVAMKSHWNSFEVGLSSLTFKLEMRVLFLPKFVAWCHRVGIASASIDVVLRIIISHHSVLFLVVSKQPLVDYYIKMKITNLSGKKILLIPGDNDPASGMPINANVIAMITKDCPVVEPNVPALQFAVVDAETRKQFLLINGTQIKTLRPVKSKNVIPIHLVIGKPGNWRLTS